MHSCSVLLLLLLVDTDPVIKFVGFIVVLYFFFFTTKNKYGDKDDSSVPGPPFLHYVGEPI